MTADKTHSRQPPKRKPGRKTARATAAAARRSAKAGGKSGRASVAARPPAPCKLDIVHDMLLRRHGATVREMMVLTGWRHHTLRARISGIAKRHKLKIERTTLLGETLYRAEALTPAAAAMAERASPWPA